MLRRLRLFLVAALLAGGLVPVFSQPAAAVGGGVVSVLQCTPGPMKQVDPIVNPGGGLSAHMHQFFGGTAIKDPGTETTVQQMQNGSTTCPLDEDTAGYWVPTLHRANGTVIEPTFLNAYYRSPIGQEVRPFPEGFGIVCGLDKDRPDCDESTQTETGWGCTDQEAFPTISQALPCPDKLIAHVQMNPTDVTLPKVTVHVRYPITDGTGYYLSADAQMGSSDGRMLHSDFWNTWDPAMMRRLVEALNRDKTCKVMTNETVDCLPPDPGGEPEPTPDPTPTPTPSPTPPPGVDEPNPVITATSVSAVTGSSQDGWTETARLSTIGSDCGDFGPLTNVKVNYRDGTGAKNESAPFTVDHEYFNLTKPHTFLPKVILTCDGELYEAETSFVLG